MKDNVGDIPWILIFPSWQVAREELGKAATDENYTHSVKTRKQLLQTFSSDIWNIPWYNFFEKSNILNSLKLMEAAFPF